jgi:hypothetical protein
LLYCLTALLPYRPKLQSHDAGKRCCKYERPLYGGPSYFHGSSMSGERVDDQQELFSTAFEASPKSAPLPENEPCSASVVLPRAVSRKIEMS